MKSSTAPNQETLKEIAQRLRKTLRDGAMAETIVATEVMKLEAHWDAKWRDQCDGMEIGPWLSKYVKPGVTLAWYRSRAKAAEAMPAIARCVETSALVWLWNHLPKEDIDAARFEISRVYRDRENKSFPLSKAQIVKLSRKYIISDGKQKPVTPAEMKARIRRLEAQIRDLGAEPVE